MAKEHRIKFNKGVAIIAIVVLMIAGGFLGYPKYLAHRQAARRDAFIQKAAAANALYAEGKFEPAIPALEKILADPPAETTPELIGVYNNLAMAQSALQRFDEAQKTLNQAKAKLDALPATEVTEPDYVRERVRMLTGIANILIARGKLREAERLYVLAVTLSPGDAAAHANLANAYFIEGNPSDAERQFELAYARMPDNPETLDNWGLLLLNTKRPVNAEAKFREAIKLNSKGAKYYYGLGLALRAQHRMGPALVMQQTAITYNPNMIEPFLESADMYFQLRDYDKSETYLRGALHLDENNLQAILALARLLALTTAHHQPNYLESAMLFKQAVDLTKGQDVNLLTQLSDMYALAEAPDQAEETLHTAMARAKEEHLTDIDMEVLRQHELAHFLLQNPPGTTKPSPLSSVGDLFGMFPKPPDPYDDAEPETPAPIVVHPVALPFTITPGRPKQ